MKNNFADKRFLYFLRYGVWAAIAAHILFGLFFLWIGSGLLAAFNVLSVCIYAICFWLVRRRHITTSLMLTTAEVIAHAGLAVWVIGWNSGFHYYIIPLMMLATFQTNWPSRGKIAYAVLVWLSYVALNQGLIVREPNIAIGTIALDAVRWFNITLTFGLIGFLAHYYAKAAREAGGKLEQLAFTDTLTGLYNRRQFMALFEHEHVKFRRNHRSLSIILIDVDNFKSINDRFGHDCGDSALKIIADCFRQSVRAQDHVARWGGEEFLVLLPETNLAGAQILAEKVRELISRTPIATGNQTIRISITASVGEFLPEEEFGSLLSRVDHGLLAGKRAGKNQVVLV